MNDVTVVTASIPPRSGMLREAVATVANQTLTPAAHIVAIDHSGSGESATRNRALRGVDTTWTAFLDHDDLLYPHRLEVLMRAAEETGADVVYPWFDVQGGTDPFPWAEGKPFDEDRFHEKTYVPITVLVRTAYAQSFEFATEGGRVWNKYSLDPAKGFGPDWAFFLECLQFGAKFHHVPERTWAWRHHASNTSGRLWTDMRF